MDVLKQQIVLSDGGKDEIRLTVPKSILKSYKNATIKSIKNKEDKYENNHFRKRG